MLRVVGVGTVEGGCDSPALPGVWHWLEPMMNVTYGYPWNWPPPGSPNVPRWKFPFSKPISSSGKAGEQPVRQHRRRGSQSFSSRRIQRRSERGGWTHALAAVSSAKPRNVNPSGSPHQGWGLNLVKSCTHVWFLFRFLVVFTLVAIIFQRRKLHLNQDQFSFQQKRMKEDGMYEWVKGEKWRRL